MYCRKCGKWIPDDSNYCNYCGNKITLDKKEKRAVWLLVLLIILCLIGSYIPIRYLWKQKYPDHLDYEKLSQSVVKINAYDPLGEALSSGSGVIILYDNVIVTCYHVIDGETLTLEVVTDRGDKIKVKNVIAYSEEKDLALLELEEAPGYSPLPIGDSVRVKKGDKVSTIGSPLGLINTVSEGIVSGFVKDREITAIQFTAPISPGNSGGALMNRNGELIGITYSGYWNAQNMNFAIPAYEIDNLLAAGRVDLPFIDFYNLTEHENLLKTVKEFCERGRELNGMKFAVVGEIAEKREDGAYIIDPGSTDGKDRIFVDFRSCKKQDVPTTGTVIYTRGLFINASEGAILYADNYEVRS